MIRVFNIDKTKELDKSTLDLSKGYLIASELEHITPAVEAVEEKGHYVTVHEYPNGGKDVEWVIDQEGVEPQPEKREIEVIDIYVPYTNHQLALRETQAELNKYQQLLDDSDYWALKYIEGYYTEEEYAEKKEIRESYRVKVRELTNKLEELEIKEDNT